MVGQCYQCHQPQYHISAT